jgi:hypothetical protein
VLSLGTDRILKFLNPVERIVFVDFAQRPALIGASSLKGTQKSRSHLPFTRRQKQIQFPKRCVFLRKTMDDGQIP